MGFLMGLLYAGFDVLAILLLIAIWQRTRMAGFLLVALSYGIGLVFRSAMPLLMRLLGEGGYESIGLISQGVFVGTSIIALAGFWNLYSGFRRRPAASPPAA